ncbi:PndA family protein [Escherichia coli 2.3916]|nr:PndA family protein [Escherichia coli 2.3916]
MMPQRTLCGFCFLQGNMVPMATLAHKVCQCHDLNRPGNPGD